MADFFEKGWKLQRADILFDIGAGKGQIGLQHRLHVLDILVEPLEIGIVAGERQLQLEAGEDGAQIMADAVQHGGALLHLPLDTLAHQDEGEARAPHFVRAARGIGGDLLASAKVLGRLGKRFDGLDLAAQEQNGDGDQHQRCTHHPDKEDMSVGGIGRAAAGKDAQRLVFQLDADFDQRAVTIGIDPERPADLLG
ncbi:hypothetical protein D3C72_1354410 [compost metagenome]